MKFPSISSLAFDARRTFMRFPLSLISALIGTGIAIYLVELELFEEQLALVNLLLTAALGIPLFFCIRLLGEQLQLSKKNQTLFQVGGLVFLGLIYWSFPVELSFDTNRAPYIRYLIYNLTIHLFVAILPFAKNKSQLGFWNYNKVLFLRLVLGALYSAVIFLGILFALLAIMALFDAEIDPKTFAQLFFSTVGVFNTWFFLAGIPKEFNQDFSEEDYPKGLRVFTQFVLIPLLLFYLVILYVYGGKIMVTWDWPRGIVSYMIIAISVLGIFTNLLLFPSQEFKDSGWIKLFYKAFYFLLFPLIILMFFAIGIRIEEYGLTVNRYIIALLGIWLSFIALYFSFGKKDIKVIPISLAAFMIFSSFGPWGMFGLSKRIQVNRLSQVLEENGLLQDGKIQQEIEWNVSEEGAIKPISEVHEAKLDEDALNEVNSIIQYLADYHGLKDLESWFDQDLKSIMETSATNSRTNSTSMDWDELYIKSIGLDYITSYQLEDGALETVGLHFEASGEFSYPIEQFELLTKFDLSRYPKSEAIETKLSLSLDQVGESVVVINSNGKNFSIKMDQFIRALQLLYSNNYNSVSWEEMKFEYNSEELELVLFFESIDAQIQDGDLIIESMKGFALKGKQEIIDENP